MVVTDFGEINWSKELVSRSNLTKCVEHELGKIKPVLSDSLSSNVGFAQNEEITCGDQSCIMAESQVRYFDNLKIFS